MDDICCTGQRCRQHWLTYPTTLQVRHDGCICTWFEPTYARAELPSCCFLFGCLPPQNNKFNRLPLQQIMVQAIPWLDWQQHVKGGEVRTLAEWLWWLAVTAPQQGVVGAQVATDQPAVAPAVHYRVPRYEFMPDEYLEEAWMDYGY
jgi:hypothetical protein